MALLLCLVGQTVLLDLETVYAVNNPTILKHPVWHSGTPCFTCCPARLLRCYYLSSALKQRSRHSGQTPLHHLQVPTGGLGTETNCSSRRSIRQTVSPKSCMGHEGKSDESAAGQGQGAAVGARVDTERKRMSSRCRPSSQGPGNGWRMHEFRHEDRCAQAEPQSCRSSRPVPTAQSHRGSFILLVGPGDSLQGCQRSSTTAAASSCTAWFMTLTSISTPWS